MASFALAPSRELITRLKEAGVVVMPSIGARRHAEKVAAWGADAVLVQGGEGGGHTGEVATSVLLPQVVDAVGIPVIAAGGFRDGRGLIAALAFGASGVAMGTRFLLTSDSTVPDAVKERYLAASVKDIVVTTKVDGLPHRMLRTDLVNSLERSGRSAGLLRAVRHAVAFREQSGMSWSQLLRDALAMKRGKDLTWGQVLLAANTPMLLRAAMVEGRPDLGVMASGQIAGLIEDLPSCAELVDRIMTEAYGTLAGLPVAGAPGRPACRRAGWWVRVGRCAGWRPCPARAPPSTRPVQHAAKPARLPDERRPGALRRPRRATRTDSHTPAARRGASPRDGTLVAAGRPPWSRCGTTARPSPALPAGNCAGYRAPGTQWLPGPALPGPRPPTATGPPGLAPGSGPGRASGRRATAGSCRSFRCSRPTSAAPRPWSARRRRLRRESGPPARPTGR